MTYQLITENNIPKFAVLPFGDMEALEDYADELWAEQSVKEYQQNGTQKKFSLQEVKEMLDPDFESLVAKNAFTLIELLTVLVIISMMATFSLIAVNSSVNSAKESKTRGTIQKLDTALQEIFEKYQDRYDTILSECDNPNTLGLSPGQQVQLKQHLMYDLMRMEMPAHWFDVLKTSGTGSFPTGLITNTERVEPIPITFPTPLGNQTYKIHKPAVFDYYFRAAQKIRAQDANAALDNGAAELLYLIMANLNPEALANFRGNEIGDIDGNGINEFHDGWGRPIQFYRFAPALTDTDRQPDIVRLSKGTPAPISPEGLMSSWTDGDQSWWKKPGIDYPNADDYANMPDAYKMAMNYMSDPFDPFQTVQRSWFLYPVIVSAGTDGKFDIDAGRKGADGILSPTAAQGLNPFNYPTGMPRDNDGNGALNHYDNISNHQR